MAKAPNIVPLKLLVISLGILLIGGTVFVIAVAADKAHHPKPPCNNVTLSLASLHEKGQLGSFTAIGNIVHLVFSDGANSTVVTLDRCTGAVEQRFTVTP